MFFITDNHPAHKTIKLNKWLEDHKERIEVFFIPPYSPELNPQEYVNQDLKTNIIGKKRAINKEQLKDNISNFMNKRKKAGKETSKMKRRANTFFFFFFQQRHQTEEEEEEEEERRSWRLMAASIRPTK